MSHKEVCRRHDHTRLPPSRSGAAWCADPVKLPVTDPSIYSPDCDPIFVAPRATPSACLAPRRLRANADWVAVGPRPQQHGHWPERHAALRRAPWDRLVSLGARDTKVLTLNRTSARRIATATIVVIAFASVATTAIVMVISPGWFPTDAGTYRAAAERLNDGHFLYRLLPGDRPMALHPPYVTVPFLSPPPIAVLWRPLALLGDASLYLWWIGCVAAILLALVLLARRRPLATGTAILLLTLPLGLALGWSNVDGYFLLALIGTWLAARSGKDLAAGVLVASMVAIKLTPAPLVLWLLAIGWYRAFAAVVGSGIVWLAVSVVGAGLPAHLEYLDVIRNTLGPGTTDLSLAGMGRAIGLPADLAGLLPPAWWLICAVAMVLLRHRPGPAFAAGILMQVLGSPVVQPYTLILLLALIAPLAWPWRTSGVVLSARS